MSTDVIPILIFDTNWNPQYLAPMFAEELTDEQEWYLKVVPILVEMENTY